MSMTIGEAAARSGVPAKTIRYYEQIGLIGAPLREANQYRTYGTQDLAMLRFIGRARRLGFSVVDLRNLVSLYRNRSRSSRDVKALAAQHLARIERKIAELQSLSAALADLVARCDGGGRPDCPILDDLSAEAVISAAKPARHREQVPELLPH